MNIRRIGKYALGLVGILALVIAGVVTYFALRWGGTYPDTPTPKITASSDPAVIAQGRYLFHSVAHCSHCHAPMDEVLAKQPGTELVPAGGEIPFGPLGTLRPPNLTNHATGVAEWSDGDLARVIRHAVKPDDTVALMMIAAGPMSDEDLTALISYMRTIEPVDNAVEPSEVSLLGRVILQTAASYVSEPKPDFPVPRYVRAGDVSVERGHYLAEGPAACFGCHSEYADRRFDESQMFCGNPEPWPDPSDPDHEIYAPNLTTHESAGRLAGMSEDQFVTRMRAPRMYAGSPMPWEHYREMTDEDLRSIFRHLQARTPCDRDVGPSYRAKG